MAKAIFRFQEGHTVGHAWARPAGQGRGTVKPDDDGDTVMVDPASNLGALPRRRHPGVSFTLPQRALEATDRRPDEAARRSLPRGDRVRRSSVVTVARFRGVWSQGQVPRRLAWERPGEPVVG